MNVSRPLAWLTVAIERLRADRWLVPLIVWVPVLLLTVAASALAVVTPDPLVLLVGFALGGFLAWVADITRYMALLLRMPSPARLARLERAATAFARVPLAPDACPACGAALRIVGGAHSPLLERTLCQFRCEGPGGHGYMERAVPLYTELHFDRWPDGDRPAFFLHDQERQRA